MGIAALTSGMPSPQRVKESSEEEAPSQQPPALPAGDEAPFLPNPPPRPDDARARGPGVARYFAPPSSDLEEPLRGIPASAEIEEVPLAGSEQEAVQRVLHLREALTAFYEAELVGDRERLRNAAAALKEAFSDTRALALSLQRQGRTEIAAEVTKAHAVLWHQLVSEPDHAATSGEFALFGLRRHPNPAAVRRLNDLADGDAYLAEGDSSPVLVPVAESLAQVKMIGDHPKHGFLTSNSLRTLGWTAGIYGDGSIRYDPPASLKLEADNELGKAVVAFKRWMAERGYAANLGEGPEITPAFIRALQYARVNWGDPRNMTADERLAARRTVVLGPPAAVARDLAEGISESLRWQTQAVGAAWDSGTEPSDPLEWIENGRRDFAAWNPAPLQAYRAVRDQGVNQVIDALWGRWKAGGLEQDAEAAGYLLLLGAGARAAAQKLPSAAAGAARVSNLVRAGRLAEASRLGLKAGGAAARGVFALATDSHRLLYVLGKNGSVALFRIGRASVKIGTREIRVPNPLGTLATPEGPNVVDDMVIRVPTVSMSVHRPDRPGGGRPTRPAHSPDPAKAARVAEGRRLFDQRIPREKVAGLEGHIKTWDPKHQANFWKNFPTILAAAEKPPRAVGGKAVVHDPVRRLEGIVAEAAEISRRMKEPIARDRDYLRIAGTPRQAAAFMAENPLPASPGGPVHRFAIGGRRYSMPEAVMEKHDAWMKLAGHGEEVETMGRFATRTGPDGTTEIFDFVPEAAVASGRPRAFGNQGASSITPLSNSPFAGDTSRLIFGIDDASMPRMQRPETAIGVHSHPLARGVVDEHGPSTTDRRAAGGTPAIVRTPGVGFIAYTESDARVIAHRPTPRARQTRLVADEGNLRALGLEAAAEHAAAGGRDGAPPRPGVGTLAARAGLAAAGGALFCKLVTDSWTCFDDGK